MLILAKAASAIAPGICLLFYFYLKDKDEPEPLKLVFRMFLLGAILVFPLMVLEGVLSKFMPGLFLQSFVVSGLTEEFMKWLMIYIFIYSHAEFDQHFDGIVYSVAVAGGFATAENLFYIFLEQEDVGRLIWLRAFLPVSGHVLFGVTMGYFLGKVKRTGQKRFIWLSLLLPVLFHGTFNSLISYSIKIVGVPLLLFMGFLWGYNIWKMNTAIRH